MRLSSVACTALVLSTILAGVVRADASVASDGDRASIPAKSAFDAETGSKAPHVSSSPPGGSVFSFDDSPAANPYEISLCAERLNVKCGYVSFADLVESPDVFVGNETAPIVIGEPVLLGGYLFELLLTRLELDAIELVLLISGSDLSGPNHVGIVFDNIRLAMLVEQVPVVYRLDVQFGGVALDALVGIPGVSAQGGASRIDAVLRASAHVGRLSEFTVGYGRGVSGVATVTAVSSIDPPLEAGATAEIRFEYHGTKSIEEPYDVLRVWANLTLDDRFDDLAISLGEAGVHLANPEHLGLRYQRYGNETETYATTNVMLTGPMVAGEVRADASKVLNLAPLPRNITVLSYDEHLIDKQIYAILLNEFPGVEGSTATGAMLFDEQEVHVNVHGIAAALLLFIPDEQRIYLDLDFVYGGDGAPDGWAFVWAGPVSGSTDEIVPLRAELLGVDLLEVTLDVDLPSDDGTDNALAISLKHWGTFHGVLEMAGAAHFQVTNLPRSIQLMGALDVESGRLSSVRGTYSGGFNTQLELDLDFAGLSASSPADGANAQVECRDSGPPGRSGLLERLSAALVVVGTASGEIDLDFCKKSGMIYMTTPGSWTSPYHLNVHVGPFSADASGRGTSFVRVSYDLTLDRESPVTIETSVYKRCQCYFNGQVGLEISKLREDAQDLLDPFLPQDFTLVLMEIRMRDAYGNQVTEVRLSCLYVCENYSFYEGCGVFGLKPILEILADLATLLGYHIRPKVCAYA